MSPYCRCVDHRIPGPHEPGCPLAIERCVGCGHALSKHRRYIHGGVNRHGSPLVCTVDNCQWTECWVAALDAAEGKGETG